MAARSTSTPLRAGLRSLVLPGWGQLAGDRPVLGWILIVVSLGLGAVAVGAATRLGALELAAWVAQPDVLLGILAANVALAVGRLVVSTHAWRSRGGRGWASATFLAVLVLAPHVLIGWAGWTTRDTLLTVFAPPSEPGPIAISAGTTTTTTSTATTTTTPTTTAPPSTTTTTNPGPTTTTTPPSSTTTVTTMTTPTTTAPPSTTTTTNPDPTTTTVPFDTERLNLLILGGDAGPGRWGLRTDTMLVGSLDVTTGDAALFSLPRNYGGITFSDGSAFPGRILNEVYAYGSDRPERFGGTDPGAAAVTDAAANMTGLDIHHFLLVDMTGFGEVVDAFGGVTLTVPEPVYGPLYEPATGGYEMIQIDEGHQTLAGGEALAYARARANSSDYVRMARQRCLLSAMLDTVDPVGLLAGLPGLTETIETHVTTDLPLDIVPDLIRLAGAVSASDVRVLGFGPDWSTGRNGDGYHVPDVERIREAVRRTVTDPGSAADLGVTTAPEACG